MKKIICIISVLCLIFMLIPINSFAATLFPNIVLGNSLSSYELTAFVGDTSRDTNIVTKSGVSAWSTDISKKQYNMYFDTSDKYIYNENVNISITYFDEGIGSFLVYYKNKSGENTASDEIRLKDSLTWKTVSVTLKSVVFDNSIGGADFKITVKNGTELSSCDVVISRVSVVPISFNISQKSSYDKAGEISETRFNCKYTNYWNEASQVQVYASVTDEKGEIVWEYSKDLMVNPNSEVYDCIIPKVDKNVLYNIEGYVISGRQRFDFSDKFINSDVNEKIGVCTHFGYSNPYIKNEDLYTAKLGGFKWIRDECAWSMVETSKGNYKIPERFMNNLDFACNNGIKMLAILDYSNTLYTNSWNSFPTTDEQIKAFENYCTFMAKSLKGKVDCFEVWNEPNSTYYGGGNVTGSAYVKVLKSAYYAIKQGNPDAYVLGGAIAADNNCMTFLKSIFDNGGSRYMDAISIHPYIWSQTPVDSSDFDFADMDKVEAAMGAKKIPIWITEVGYANADSTVANTLTEEEQGVFNVRTAIYYAADSRVERLFFYEFINKDDNTTALTYNYGMLYHNGEPKKSYDMLSNMNSCLSGTEYREKTINRDENGSGYSIYRFSGKDKDVIAMWANDGMEYNVNTMFDSDAFTANDSDGVININLSKSNSDRYVSAYDAYGNYVDLSNMSLDYSPKYIVCKKNSEMKTEYTPECSIDVSYNNISVKGKSRFGKELVALHAIKPGSNKGAYIDQCISEEDGTYSFNFQIDKNDLYAVFVNDGSGKTKLDADISNAKISLFKGTNEIKDLSTIAAGDTITAKAEFNEPPARNLSFICARFNDTSKLVDAYKSNVTEIDGKTSAEITFTVDSDKEFLRFFLWNDDMTPVINSKCIN